ncbi:endonuclease/exonuclease/phosphatase [Catenovulum agarivorans DS-2]|uniref:Endonuclease/exonuclease/phosphatase n=1 Tax=Catenovulum agarivorans DS-2 TaxID=1328313 RepID=W7QLG1_9ALTE|nr:endonuclease/exonuclease/phosphatase family protein [Catenovulum agarivorans]EWH09772.1 endonuclease/exonuclease/phosphatase [Catenovulum agarivorans DS-2]
MLLFGWIVLSVALAAVTLLPMFNCSDWKIRCWEFPRLQIFVLATLCCIFGLYINFSLAAENVNSLITWSITLLNVWVMGYQAKWLYRFLPWMEKTSRACKQPNSEQVGLKVLVANVLMKNQHKDELISLVKQTKPDIVITLESDKDWQCALDRGIAYDYPYSIKKPLNNLYGMHLYSKLAIEKYEVSYLIEPKIPSFHARVKMPSGQEIKLRVLHPKPPSPTEADYSQSRDAELLVVGKQISKDDVPTIVTGDLNDVAWSRTTREFVKLSGLKDPREGRGFFNTFHAMIPVLRWPLDHIFHSDHFSLVKMEKFKLKGSDHYSLFTELALDKQSVEIKSREHQRQDKDLAKQRMNAENADSHDVPDVE